MIPQDIWVGIDTGFDQSHLCVIDDELNLIADRILTTSATAVIEVLAANEMAKIQSIALEATACSTELVRGLREAGYPAVIYDSGQVSKYLRIRGNKTDRNDALGLAEVAKFGLPALSAVHLKSPEIQQVRALLQLRHKLIEQRVASENMVRSLLRMHGGNKLTRAHLRAAAKTLLSSRTKSSALKEWGVRLAARIGTGKAQIAVARKLAITMLAMWKDNAEFRQPNLEAFEALEIPSA